MLLAPLGAIVLPYLLGSAGYGIYSYWFGILSIFVILLDMGFQLVLRRYIPDPAYSGRERDLLFKAVRLKLYLLPTIFLAGLLIADGYTALLLTITALAASITMNLADIAYAKRRMLLHNLILFIRRLWKIVTAPLFFLLWSKTGIIYSFLASEFFSIVFAGKTLSLSKKQGDETPKMELLNIYKQGLFMFFAMLFSMLLGRLPVIIAKWYSFPDEAVGRLALAVDISYFAGKEMVNSLAESIFPQLVLHHSCSEKAKMISAISINYRMVNLIIIGLLAVSSQAIPLFLRLLGHDFLDVAKVLAMLLLAMLASCWNLIQSQILLMEHRPRTIMLSQAVGLVTFFLLAALLREALSGIWSLAMALAGGMSATSAVSWSFVRRNWSTGPATLSSFMIMAFSGILAFTVADRVEATFSHLSALASGLVLYITLVAILSKTVRQDLAVIAMGLRRGAA